MAVGEELDDEAELGLADERLDAVDEAGVSSDRDSVTDIERLFKREVAGGDDLLATTELISVGDGRHLRNYEAVS